MVRLVVPMERDYWKYTLNNIRWKCLAFLYSIIIVKVLIINLNRVLIVSCHTTVARYPYPDHI